MLFNSYEFLYLFLPLSLLIYYSLGRRDTLRAAGFLTFASLVFYGWVTPTDTILLVFSIVVNFLLSRGIYKSFERENSTVARHYMVVGVLFNLALLGFFKYANFVVENLNLLLDLNLAPSRVALPLGISFFTFTQIAYLVDSYRDRLKPFSWVQYGLFVTYFPHLVAGPILHHREMLPQFAARKTYLFSWRNLSVGLSIFILGLAKKLLIADQMAPLADRVFASPAEHFHPFDAWLASLAYTLQIYFDFSGYSDMAIGLARMFGANIPINFNSPYKATNIVEFWRRWHISLSRFLRDYLYIPLGGNRRGPARRYGNLMTTMLLGGLWHGASWNFVIWGGLHGVYLGINHAWQKSSKPLPKGLGAAVTFVAVAMAWVFFRAETVTGALNVLQSMFALSTESPRPLAPMLWWQWALLSAALLICWLFPNTQEWTARYLSGFQKESLTRSWPQFLLWRINLWYALALALLLAACLIKMKSIAGPEFIYYNF